MSGFLWIPDTRDGGGSLDPGLEQNIQLGKCPLEIPLRNDCARCFSLNPSEVCSFPSCSHSCWLQSSYPNTCGSGDCPYQQSPSCTPDPCVCVFPRIFFSQKLFFTENSSSQVGAVLYERISVFIPHKDPLQEDKWVIRIYDTNWLLWKWLENGQSVLPVNSPKDIISSRHTSEEETWHQPPSPSVQGARRMHVLSRLQQENGDRMPGSSVPPCSVSIHHRKYPGGREAKHLCAIWVLSEIPRVRYSTSHTLQIRKSKFREIKWLAWAQRAGT